MNDRSQNAKHDRNVGYKKPPRESQFKKGQSGNRRGRPRRVARPKSMAQIFREVASETVKIEGEGGPIVLPRWEAFVRQIHTMALNRDASAARVVHQLRK